MCRKFGNGKTIRLWDDVWIGVCCLKDLFPRLYTIAMNNNAWVYDLGKWVGDKWEWEWRWRRDFFVWKEESYEMFQGILKEVSPSKVTEDEWFWKEGNLGVYSVKSAYQLISSSNSLLTYGTIANPLFRNLWKCNVPSKVIALSWRIILNRLQIRENLLKRGVIMETKNVKCVFCDLGIELVQHLFFECVFVVSVWYSVYNWMGIYVAPLLMLLITIFGIGD